jgi:hypothetical protein
VDVEKLLQPALSQHGVHSWHSLCISTSAVNTTECLLLETTDLLSPSNRFAVVITSHLIVLITSRFSLTSASGLVWNDFGFSVWSIRGLLGLLSPCCIAVLSLEQADSFAACCAAPYFMQGSDRVRLASFAQTGAYKAPCKHRTSLNASLRFAGGAR